LAKKAYIKTSVHKKRVKHKRVAVSVNITLRMIELGSKRSREIELDAPNELVPAISDKVDKLALALHVKEVAPKLNKGQVEKDDCNSPGSRVAQDLYTRGGEGKV
jgi:hypothetical protein